VTPRLYRFFLNRALVDDRRMFGEVVRYMASQVIELDRDKLAPYRVSVFLCSDDSQANSVVKGLAEELGFVGVDCGELERARLVKAVADFTRFQIIGMGLGPFATILINVLP
jgi:8-hydroxy-5-deazaflavin:NADPH oxidoreductase